MKRGRPNWWRILPAVVGIVHVAGGCIRSGGLVREPTVPAADSMISSRVAWPALSGRVYFPGYQTQATISDVAIAATVSLIDPARNETQATTVSDESGGFTLDVLGSFVPADKVYYVEAVKGLESHAVGKDAVRVRTLVQFRSGSWTSLTGGSPVVISRATTALAAIVSLRQSTSPVDPAALMGNLEVAGQNTTFRDAGTGVGKTEWSTVLDLVTTALLADHDPLEGLLYGGGSYDLKPGISPDTRPFIKVVRPTLAAVGEEIRIEGSGFGAEPASVSVRFTPGVAAVATLRSPTELRAVVPQAARTGEIEVQVGSAVTSAPFVVLTGLDGSFVP